MHDCGFPPQAVQRHTLANTISETRLAHHNSIRSDFLKECQSDINSQWLLVSFIPEAFLKWKSRPWVVYGHAVFL